MKKYLLPVLAGLLITSCSQDDEFYGASEPVASYSPITFSVSTEGAEDADATRAWEVSDANAALQRWGYYQFENNELLSLFNGMKFGSAAWTSIGTNAIYKASATAGEGGTGALQFSTQSMVYPGTAIMIYPADTAFAQNESAFVVSLPAEQNQDTKNLIPMVSDFMSIADYPTDGDWSNTQIAGYGRNYNVKLRYVGSLLSVALTPTATYDFAALGIDPVQFTKVSIDNASAALFTTKATLTPGIASSLADDEGYAHTISRADVTIDASFAASKITTTDIKNNVAYFSLLPIDSTKTSDASSIVVTTNYGSVTISNNASAADTDKGPLQNNAKNTGKNLTANLKNAYYNAWRASGESVFGDEKQGRVVRRTLSVDMSTLDMDGTVVTTTSQLISLLKLYKELNIAASLGSSETVTLTLNAEGKEFKMTDAALKQLKESNAAKKIILDVTTNSQKIKLTDAKLEDLDDATVIFNSGASPEVILAGTSYTLDQNYLGRDASKAKISEIISRTALTYTNTANKGALVLPLSIETGSIAFSGTDFNMGEFKTASGTTMTVAEGQSVQFDGVATLDGAVTNNGIISANAEVTNNGTIDNKYEVSVLGAGSGEFNNYGIIKNNGLDAVTFITANGDGITKLGRIVLTNRDDNVSVDTNQGYIVFEWDTTDSAFGTTIASEPTDVFNWLTVKTSGSNARITFADDISNVDYLRIEGTAVNVTTPTGGLTVTDLFVDKSMRLLGTNAITATNIYIADYILTSGHLSGSLEKEYTSGVAGEQKDVNTYKNGKIRTN